MPIVAETLDPARSDNMQANMLMAGIYDTLYVLDPLARPAVIVPLAAEALPEVSPDFREFTIRVRPGIRFTPHAAFGGKARELTATDFAYALRRVFDPKIHSQGLAPCSKARSRDSTRSPNVRRMRGRRSTTMRLFPGWSRLTGRRCGFGSTSRTRYFRSS